MARIRSAELETLIRDRLFAGTPTQVPVIVSDEAYLPVARSRIAAMARTGPLVLPPELANPELYDCDDYALGLRQEMVLLARRTGQAAPPAIGVLMSRSHAINFFVDPARNLWIADLSRQVVPGIVIAPYAGELAAQVRHDPGEDPLQAVYI